MFFYKLKYLGTILNDFSPAEIGVEISKVVLV